jgi:hypothetical protein
VKTPDLRGGGDGNGGAQGGAGSSNKWCLALHC